MIDFITILFNNELELSLLKLQAMSMKYVDINLINNIIIAYNDDGLFDINLIIDYYPEILKDKVKIVNVIDTEIFINLKKNYIGWVKQQLVKILICKYVEAKYYLIMDGKNHFIRNVNYNDYFSNDNKQKIFTSYLNEIKDINKCFFNCLDYFGIDGEIFIKKKMLFVTTTPFLFNTKDVLDMIDYISTKENMSFVDFFLKNQYKYTEFFIYSSYLHFSNKLENYHICNFEDINYISIMHDVTQFWNTYENRAVVALNNTNIKAFGLHRKAIATMDLEYKKNLLYFYKQIYRDDIIFKFIQDNLLCY